jgi:hypothetical protein
MSVQKTVTKTIFLRAPIHVQFCLQFELTDRTETVLPVPAPHHTQTDRTVSPTCNLVECKCVHVFRGENVISR